MGIDKDKVKLCKRCKHGKHCHVGKDGNCIYNEDLPERCKCEGFEE